MFEVTVPVVEVAVPVVEVDVPLVEVAVPLVEVAVPVVEVAVPVLEVDVPLVEVDVPLVEVVVHLSNETHLLPFISKIGLLLGQKQPVAQTSIHRGFGCKQVASQGLPHVEKTLPL